MQISLELLHGGQCRVISFETSFFLDQFTNHPRMRMYRREKSGSSFSGSALRSCLTKKSSATVLAAKNLVFNDPEIDYRRETFCGKQRS